MKAEQPPMPCFPVIFGPTLVRRLTFPTPNKMFLGSDMDRADCSREPEPFKAFSSENVLSGGAPSEMHNQYI